MKAARIDKPGQVSLCSIGEPKVGDDDVLIKVEMIGLCGSDLATYRGSNPMVSYPRIPGHEIAGCIEQIGGNVPDELAVGTRVTVSPYTACGKCSACLAGRANCCRYNQTMGVQRDGAATEYIAVPYEKVVKAGGLSTEQITCIEPLSVGWHACGRAQVAESEIVLVFGCGVIGLGAIAAAVSKGAEVIAVDIDINKLKKAEVLGAKHLVNSAEENLQSCADEITSGHGPVVVIEAVGLPQTFTAAVELVSFAGRVVYIGYAKEKVEYETKLFVSKELDIRGSRNAVKSEFEDVIEMIRGGRIDIGPFVTQRYSLEQIGEALGFWDGNPDDVTKILISL